MREVTLKIKVDDREVTQGTASVERLRAAAANSTGLSSGRKSIETDEQQRKLANFLGRELPQAAKQTESAISAVESATAGAGEGLSGLVAGGTAVVGVLGGLAAGLAVVAAGIVVIAKVSFDLSQSFAKAAIEAGNLSEETGLAVQTVTALRAETEAQGRSFSVVESAAQSFRKTIGEASAGSREATASLQALGLSKDAIYDIDGAFTSAISTIRKTPNEVEQARLAFAAFGDDGAKLLPILRDLKSNADAFGKSMSGEDVAAAREFNRALEEIKQRAQGVTYTFGRELLPVVSEVLSDFGKWLDRNKGDVRAWAQGFADSVRDIIDALNNLKALATSDTWQEGIFRFLGTLAPNSPLGVGLAALNNGSRNQGVTAGIGGAALVPDDGALAAKFGYKPPKTKDIKPELTEAEKQAKALREIIADLNREIDFYGDKSEVAATKQKIMAIGVKDLTTRYSAEAISLAAILDKKNLEAEAFKKAEEAREKYAETLQNTREGVANSAFDERLSLIEQLTVLQKQADLGRELSDFEKSRVSNVVQLTQVREAARRAGLNEKDLSLLEQQIIKEQELTDVIRERIQVLVDEAKEKERIKALEKSFQNFGQSLEDQLDAVRRGNQPLSVYEETLRAIGRDYKDLDPAQKQQLLDISAQIDAITELNRQHAELKDFFQEGLRYVFDGDFSGLLGSFGDHLKDTLADKLSDIFATNLLGFDPKKTNNPVARPIVDKLDETNKILRGMAVGAGGGAAAGVAGGGSGGGIIGKILGAFGIGGQGPGGTPNFNGDATSIYGGPSQLIGDSGSSGLFNTINLRGGGSYTARSGILGQLLGPGGIFGAKGFGNNVGTYGGIGGLASIAGGLLGGRVGGLISGAGSGLGLGAQIGSLFGPGGTAIGAAIGAVAGGLFGLLSNLFGGNKQRRADEATRNQATLDAESSIRKQFDGLATQLRFGQIDSASAIIQGTNIGDQVRTQYLQVAGSLKDKKTRNIALRDVSRIDSLIASKMAELRGLADIAQGSADRSKRILPEFAGGHYFADYFRPNGLLPGMFDGRDDILAKISRGEMVLNPSQISNVRRAAGFDVFATAGIPNYPKANPSSHLATGGIVGGSGLATAPQVVMQPRFTLVVEGATFDQRTKAYLMGDDGNRTLVEVIKSKQKDKSI